MTRFGRHTRATPALALAAIALLAAPGCGGGGTRSSGPSSGDPEADQRAEMRVGSGGEAGTTLYERLGGADMITAIVDDMTARVIADPRVNFERKNVKTNWFGGEYDPWEPTAENVARFKKRMVEFLSVAAGGPARYTGRDIRTAHKGMKINNNEFDAMVGDVKASMDKLGIANAEQVDLLAIIETTRKQIVEKN